MKDISNWKIRVLCTIFAFGFMFVGIHSALADITCRGSLGRVTIDDTLLVPQNSECTLNGTQVNGNINLKTNATLRASDVYVDGNIQTIEDNVRRVDVFNNSTVSGNIQIIHSGAADIREVQIEGDLQLESNENLLNAERNFIGGNLQAFQNTGGVAIVSNSIDGNLQCEENVPAPTGGNNVVDGNMEDQCRNFGGTPHPGPEPPPSGDSCNGSYGASTTFENLFVPENGICILNGTWVEGNIEVQENATLEASRIRVGGNIQTIGSNVTLVEVLNSVVGGNIQITQSRAANIIAVEIDGDLQFDSNNETLNAESNLIGGNLQAFQNTGGVAVFNNSINGNLQCKTNVPAPIGNGNVVNGNMEDQCSNFGGVPTLTPSLHLLL